jgi:hypothetical protein
MPQIYQHIQTLLAAGALAFLNLNTSPADDWPAWRGPNGNGISTESEKNSLDEEMYTTPAISNGQLFVRTTTALVCISE